MPLSIPPGRSFTQELLKAVAGYLADGGVGVFAPDGIYSAAGQDGPVIVLSDVPAQPDRLIALSLYTVADDPSLSDSVVGLQVRTRGAAAFSVDVDSIDDAVFTRLHGARGITGDGLRIVQALRRSGTPLGRDDNRRPERSSNYYLTVHRPSQHRV